MPRGLRVYNGDQILEAFSEYRPRLLSQLKAKEMRTTHARPRPNNKRRYYAKP